MGITWGELHSKLLLNAKETKIPVTASFELTSRCNLQCKMCYLSQKTKDNEIKAGELTAAQWIRLAKEARDAGLLYLTLTGGEVFLREDFREIYEELMKLGLVIQIYTNGTLITDKIVQWLTKIPPSKVSITLYGSCRETYEKVTGHADAYDKTVRAINSLCEAGIQTEVKTTLVQANKHEFLQLFEFARQKKLRLGIVNYISPRREGDNSDPLGNRLSPRQLAEYEINVIKRNRELAEEEKETVRDAAIDNTVMQEINPSQTINGSDPFSCSAGKCGTWITWDGRMLPCGLLDRIAVDPLKEGFKNAWEKLKYLCTTEVPVCQACQDCKYKKFCERCPARLVNETGFFDRPAPYLCEMARERSNIMDDI